MNVPARPWIIMALIFLLGGATGALLTVGFGPRFLSGPPGPQEMRNHWMHHLTWRLHLTDDQQAKIQPIIDTAEKQIQDVHHQDVAAISSIMKKANADMQPILNADQQAELQKMETERERMFDGHMHGFGHPPDGPFHGPGDDHDDGHPPEPPPSGSQPAPSPAS